MVRSLVILFASHCLAFLAATAIALANPPLAQPVISYIIPDIGTPGMNTYVELIGPYDADGNFGNLGLYLNNSGDAVQVKCVNAADTDKIKFGPVLVGWNGRMAATQAFVLPWVQPNSDDWKALTNAFRIPIVFTTASGTSNVDTFYIVQSHAAINAVAGATLGSGGPAGLRSRRGAMVVDGVTLSGSGTITVSTNDCDAATPGNQGYLPFVLLSIGPVVVGAGITVDIGASGKNGGPGGGGGGCGDGPTGEVGGTGYVGGGSGELKSRPATGGDGTGSNGNSNAGGNALNALPGSPADAMVCQSAGGSGNPFVTTSGGWYANNQLHDGCGPGGGFATVGDYGRGEYFPTPDFFGGKVNGNKMLVPMMGGSGGGGGNEFCSYSADGSPGLTGGGGGGAMVLFGRSLTISNMSSDGGQGVTSGYGCVNHGSYGGGGSGGAIALLAKMTSTFGTLSVKGATGGHAHPGSGTGGSGRIRNDGPSAALSLTTPTDASQYRGVSTDTSQYVPRTFTLTGSGNGNSVKIYVRSISGPWQLNATVTGYTNNAWQQVITLPGCDTMYLLAAAQTVPSPSTITEQLEPVSIMSQAAANFLYTSGGSDLTLQAKPFRTLICDSVTDTIFTIKNLCSTDVVIDAITLAQLGTDFSFVPPPTLPFTLRGGKDTTFTVRFFRRTAGTLTATITVHALSPIQKTLVVTLSGQRNPVAALAASATQFIPALCDSIADGSVTIANSCGTPILVDSLLLTQNNEGFSFGAISFPFILQGNSVATVPIHFAPQFGGQKTAVVWIMTNGNPLPALTTGLAGTRDTLGASIAASADRFQTLVCDSVVDTLLHVTNACGSDLIIDSIYFTPANSGFSLAPPQTMPIIVHGGRDTTLVLRFTKGTAGTSSGTIYLRSNASNKKVFTLSLTGKRDTAGANAFPLDFGLLDQSQLPTSGAIRVTNTGTVSITITAAMFRGFAPFMMLSTLPVTIPPGGSTDLSIQFSDPGSDSLMIDTLRISFAPSCVVLSVEVRGQRKTVVRSPFIRSNQVRQLGNLICGSDEPDSVWVHNTGTGDLTISAPTFAAGIVGFALVTPTIFPKTIAPNDSLLFIVRFIPTTGVTGISIDTLLLPSNDTIAGHSPWRIAYAAQKDSAGFALSTLMIDCGTLCPATTFDTTLVITNTGTVAMTAVGTLAAPFSLNANRWPLPGGGSTFISLHMMGTGVGQVLDTLWLTDTVCNRTKAVVLRANISAPRITVEAPTLLGMCAPVDSTVEIVNMSAEDAVITSFSASDTSFHFPGLTLPIMLRAGDSVAVPIRFFSSDTGTITGTITVADAPCPAVVKFSVSGRRVKPLVTMAMPPVAKHPGDTVLIPITLQSLTPPFTNPAVRVHLLYNELLLNPMRAVGGTMSSTGRGELEFSSFGMDNAGLCGGIVFRVMAYRSDSAGILMDSVTLNGCDVSLSSTPIDIQVVNGCKDTFQVAYVSSAALLPITPNPFSTTMLVRYRTVESTHSRIVVEDLLGRCVGVLVDRDDAPGEHAVSCDARGWSAGLYVLTMESGAVRDRRFVVLQR